MSVDVTIPKMGLTMTECELVEWLVASGEIVQRGQAIAVVESEKIEAELEADADGVLEHLVSAGETVAVEAVIGRISPSEATE